MVLQSFAGPNLWFSQISSILSFWVFLRNTVSLETFYFMWQSSVNHFVILSSFCRHFIISLSSFYQLYHFMNNGPDGWKALICELTLPVDSCFHLYKRCAAVTIVVPYKWNAQSHIIVVSKGGISVGGVRKMSCAKPM